MIKDEEIARLIRDSLNQRPANKMETQGQPDGMDTVDQAGAYQVYEVTYERSVRVGKTVLARFLGRQEARELVRQYRNALGYHEVIEKGYGFEKMEDASDDME